jgi:tripartite-type tricarboxylate transporter receptor subunit TctC
MDRRDLVKGGIAAVSAGLLFRRAAAQGVTRRLIYPYAAGDGGDVLTRLVANELQDRLGVTTVVENHTGADGRIGVRDVKNAKPDGDTLLSTPFAPMSLFPSVFADLGYDPFRDFAPITQMATFDFAIAAGPKTPAKTLAEFVEWAKANPKDANYGVTGLGTVPHFLPLVFAKMAGIQLQPVPYRGPVPAITATMAGEVPIACTPLGDQLPQHRAGNIRILASSGASRSQYAPDIPTFIEQGFNVHASGWYGLFAPAGVAKETVDKVQAAAVAALKADALIARTKALFLNLTGTSSQQLATILKSDFDLWAPVVKESGFYGK